MKKLFFFLLLAGFSAHAQQKDSIHLYNLPKDGPKLEMLKQRLVELANGMPLVNLYKDKALLAKYDLTKAQVRWLELFTAQGNLNELSLKGNNNGQNIFFPRYNFGVSLTLGTFVSIPTEVKAARANQRIMMQQKEDLKITNRTNVLKLYQSLATAVEIYKLHSPLVQDALLNFQQAEADFKEDKIDVEEYKTAFRAYNEEKTNELVRMRDLQLAKLDLEGAIGVTLESVLQGVK